MTEILIYSVCNLRSIAKGLDAPGSNKMVSRKCKLSKFFSPLRTVVLNRIMNILEKDNTEKLKWIQKTSRPFSSETKH